MKKIEKNLFEDFGEVGENSGFSEAYTSNQNPEGYKTRIGKKLLAPFLGLAITAASCVSTKPDTYMIRDAGKQIEIFEKNKSKYKPYLREYDQIIEEEEKQLNKLSKDCNADELWEKVKAGDLEAKEQWGKYIKAVKKAKAFYGDKIVKLNKDYDIDALRGAVARNQEISNKRAEFEAKYKELDSLLKNKDIDDKTYKQELVELKLDYKGVLRKSEAVLEGLEPKDFVVKKPEEEAEGPLEIVGEVGMFIPDKIAQGLWWAGNTAGKFLYNQVVVTEEETLEYYHIRDFDPEWRKTHVGQSIGLGFVAAAAAELGSWIYSIRHRDHDRPEPVLPPPDTRGPGNPTPPGSSGGNGGGRGGGNPSAP